VPHPFRGRCPRGYSWETATSGNQIARTHGIYASDLVEVATKVVGDLLPPGVI